MILSLFIMLEVFMFVSFFISFFTKQELLWVLTLILSGTLMITSYNVEIIDSTMELAQFTFPVMMGVNTVFFIIALMLALLDYFDKYGISTFKFKIK